MIWVLALLLSGCATSGVIVPNNMYSIGEIRAAIVQVVGEPRFVSKDQRELLSQYFSPRPDPNFNPDISKERLVATFNILGDRRPYDVRVEVTTEKKISGAYKRAGENSMMSKRVAKELKERLNQSREGRSLIDDFRPF
jgi:hypothetical protein